MKVKNIVQTCGACPSQWEGTIEDGRMFYARYRWGTLTIQISKKPTNDVYDAMDETLYSKEIGNEYDGVMSQADLMETMVKIGFSFN